MPPFFDDRGDPAISPYEVLKLPTTASETDIKKAYRTSMLQLHPDKLSPDLSEDEIAAVTEKFHNVKDAYEFLTCPQYLTARRLYMAKMASKRAEFERREAFLRRAGMHNSSGHTVHTARTRMTEAPPQPAFRPAAEPTVNVKRSSAHAANGRGVGQPRYYNSHAVDPAQARARGQAARRSRGYTSDGNYRTTRMSAATNSNSNSRTTATTTGGRESRARRSDQPRHSSRRGRTCKTSSDARVRSKSEPRRDKSRDYSSGTGSSDVDDQARFEEKNANGKRRSNVKSSGNNNVGTRRSRERVSSRQRPEERRSRAKSAPARCSVRDRKSQSNSNNTSSNNDNVRSSDKIPKEFICPLSKRLMKDPVVDPDGNAYEREAIERWLRVQSSSPITNGYLSVEMLRPSKDLKSRIYKLVGKPRSKSQCPRTRSKTRSSSPNETQNNQEFVSGRVLVDSYLREISSKSKLSVSLDGMGICAFSYRKITFVIEVPIVPNAGFMVYSSFDARNVDRQMLSRKIDAWNKWLMNIRWASRVSHVMAGNKTVFSLKGSEKDMMRCDVFQKTLEYFVEMSLKLHNILHPEETKSIDNVCLTRTPVCVG